MAVGTSHSGEVCIAILPARAGSKRIPRKNIRDFCGKPIIEYSIKAALESQLFESVVVSSDDDRIGSIAAQAGAVYYRRHPASARDNSPMVDAVREVLNYQANRGEVFDKVCMIYPCAPFLTGARLQEGYLHMTDGYDFCYPVFHGPPMERAMYINNGKIHPRMPYHFSRNGQDWPESYYPAEGWWWARCSSIEIYNALYGGWDYGLVVPRHEVQAIDTEEDWKEAEHRWGALHGSE